VNKKGEATNKPSQPPVIQVWPNERELAEDLASAVKLAALLRGDGGAVPRR